MKKMEMMTFLVSIEALLETNNEKKALEVIKKVISHMEKSHRRDYKEKWRHKHEDRKEQKERWRERHMHKHESRWEDKARHGVIYVNRNEGKWEEKAKQEDGKQHQNEDLPDMNT